MNAILDDVLVGALLLVSLGYAVTKLGPRSLRTRVLAALSRMLAAAPAFLGLAGAARRLESTAGKTQGACGGCDNCGSETKATQPAEISVPIGRIGRRA